MLAIRARRADWLAAETLVWGFVLAAWTLMLTLPPLGHGGHLSHDALPRDGAWPPLGDLLLFLAAWQVMTGAMMLPSSLPLIGLFARASRAQAAPRRALAAFLAAYFAAWTGFAGVALAADAGLHALIARWHWLHTRPWLVAGGVLLLAGVFQFSPLKERCLTACRDPLSFLWRHYARGGRAAWALGLRHGLFCLGCCWALMLTMFALGVGNLAWMAALTGVMAIEKTARWGRRLVPLVGGTLLVWGALVLLQPGWLPASLGGI